MMYFGLFTLVVMPLFLAVCIGMIKRSNFAGSFWGRLLEVVFVMMIGLTVALGLWLFLDAVYY